MSLLLLSGPSGVGKTSILKVLCDDYHALRLRNFTTRPLRPGEQERYFLTDGELDDFVKADKVAFVNELLGARYGVMRDDLEAAVSADAGYVFDIYPSFLGKLTDNFSACVFLLPKSLDQLQQQLKDGGREERIATCADEVRHTQEAAEKWKADARCWLAVCSPGRIRDVAKQIAVRSRLLPE